MKLDPNDLSAHSMLAERVLDAQRKLQKASDEVDICANLEKSETRVKQAIVEHDLVAKDYLHALKDFLAFS